MAEDEVKKKFIEMTSQFRSNAEGLMGEIIGSFSNNLGAATKNYGEMQQTYKNGYDSVAQGAKKANDQLLQTMDKNYADLKAQILQLKTDTVTKSNSAIDAGVADFKAQYDKVSSKFPNLPEAAYKETIKSLQDSKARVNSTIENQHKETLAKMEKNYAETRKELTLPAFKEVKLPTLAIESQKAQPAAAAGSGAGPSKK